MLIRPMSFDVIEQFCDSWMMGIHKNYKTYTPQQALGDARVLKEAIKNNRQTRELATNPLMVTVMAMVVCSLGKSGKPELPLQRR